MELQNYSFFKALALWSFTIFAATLAKRMDFNTIKIRVLYKRNTFSPA
ncbi:hypothetical protein SAMN06265219_104177 [Gracilimonas mengyeensis]|uniref:Uncharacterized protein n=1 Tax=Gracilimonas mengyeensis TaxID=1302730 RepID=A0A521C5D4_9BACT|nr:hypothetical protein SAMN06265219_104177 [Gracilimonas mengyeensis]